MMPGKGDGESTGAKPFKFVSTDGAVVEVVAPMARRREAEAIPDRTGGAGDGPEMRTGLSNIVQESRLLGLLAACHPHVYLERVALVLEALGEECSCEVRVESIMDLSLLARSQGRGCQKSEESTYEMHHTSSDTARTERRAGRPVQRLVQPPVQRPLGWLTMITSARCSGLTFV